ncbi:MAG: hypothetical protein JWM11_1116 [Planctomycetaceae bacterium]|nr:hypothetical protein [Planctomycetaceae bacterium]
MQLPSVIAADESPGDQKNTARDEEDETEERAGNPVNPRLVHLNSWSSRSVFGASEQQEIERLKDILKRELKWAKVDHGLSDEEVKKLLLAGQIEIRQFVEKANALLTLYEDHASNDSVIQVELDRLSRRKRNESFFDRQTFFGKTLTKILQNPQRKLNVVRDAAYQKHMLYTLETYLGAEAPVRAEQRGPLAELIQRNLRELPVLFFHDPWEIEVRLMEIPDSEYQKVLDNQQLSQLRQNLEVLRSKYAIGRIK